MIARIWHGWTTTENAPIYENLLKEEIFVGIKAKKIPGYKGIDLLKRPCTEGMEFTTIMWFDSIENVKEFVGEDYSKAYVPAKAREVLLKFDERSAHYEVSEKIIY